MREEMLQRCNQVIVVAASEKFGHNGLCIRNNLDMIDTIVTDENLAQEYIDGLQDRDIDLLLAPL